MSVSPSATSAVLKELPETRSAKAAVSSQSVLAAAVAAIPEKVRSLQLLQRCPPDPAPSGSASSDGSRRGCRAACSRVRPHRPAGFAASWSGRQSRVPQHMRQQTRHQRLAARLEEFGGRIRRGPRAADPLDDRADIGFRERRADIDPVEDIEPACRRMVRAQHENPVSHPARAASSIGPSSAAGSSTTTEPVQVSKVETALVVLNEPEPATTSEWVDPSTQGSTSSGARPPWPHVAGLPGLNGPRACRGS